MGNRIRDRLVRKLVHIGLVVPTEENAILVDTTNKGTNNRFVFPWQKCQQCSFQSWNFSRPPWGGWNKQFPRVHSSVHLYLNQKWPRQLANYFPLFCTFIMWSAHIGQGEWCQLAYFVPPVLDTVLHHSYNGRNSNNNNNNNSSNINIAKRHSNK